MLMSAWLVPSDAGYGTHRQLGLPPCATVTLTGLPCPSCGMTTSFAHTARGEFRAAFGAQPAGLLLAICTALAGTFGLFSAITGKVCKLNWYRLPPARLIAELAILLVAAWLYKVCAVLRNGLLPA